jgi:hypothetical protein
MSTTIAAGSSKRTSKSTCRKCNRTVYVVQIAGELVTTDPELIAVVAFEGVPTQQLLARRVHSEMCLRYVVEADRIKARRALNGKPR